MPAAAVIPAPRRNAEAVAVKKLDFGAWSSVCRTFGCGEHRSTVPAPVCAFRFGGVYAAGSRTSVCEPTRFEQMIALQAGYVAIASYSVERQNRTHAVSVVGLTPHR